MWIVWTAPQRQTNRTLEVLQCPQFFSCCVNLCPQTHGAYSHYSIVSSCAYVVFSVCSIQDSSSFLSFHLLSPLTPFPPLLLLFSLLPVPSSFPSLPSLLLSSSPSSPSPPFCTILIPLSGQYHKGKQAELLELFSAPNSPYFFLFSTQTGCLVLEIRSADTVIFDSDWNHHHAGKGPGGAIMYFMSCH